MHNVITTVTVSRDWVDWLLFVVQLLSLIGTALAAWFAYWAIRQAKSQAQEGQEALVRERRLDFELEVLKDLVLAVTRRDVPNLRGLALMLPVEDISLTRASVDLRSTPQAARKVEQLGLPSGALRASYVESLNDEILDELRAAIEARIKARPQAK